MGNPGTFRLDGHHSASDSDLNFKLCTIVLYVYKANDPYQNLFIDKKNCHVTNGHFSQIPSQLKCARYFCVGFTTSRVAYRIFFPEGGGLGEELLGIINL